MAYGAEPAGTDPLAHTIYIWPSLELIARSWHWPESWHVAFEQAASQIGRAVAVCVLGGLPVSERPIAMELSAGCISFSVRLLGTGIYVTITEFEGPEAPGPDSPGPDGGCQQPRAADGLVLGLRGSGKCFCLVTFYGYLPPLPVEYFGPSEMIDRAFAYRRTKIGNEESDTDLNLGLFAVLAPQMKRGGPNSRAAMAPSSGGIASLAEPALARHTQTLTRVGIGAYRDIPVCAPEYPWIDATENRSLPFSEGEEFVDWRLGIRKSPFNRLHCQHLL